MEYCNCGKPFNSSDNKSNLNPQDGKKLCNSCAHLSYSKALAKHFANSNKTESSMKEKNFKCKVLKTENLLNIV